MNLKFSTKAETLHNLQGRIKSAKVLDIVFFSLEEWEQNPEKILEKIKNSFKNVSLFIVRSSSFKEDQMNASHAGVFDSILNVEFKDIPQAIEKVIDSYGKRKILSQDQILIQPMLQEVLMSGVLFTCDPATKAPYLIINYETEGNTAAITSGALSNHHTMIIAKSLHSHTNSFFDQLLHLTRELEHIFKVDSLDIEFAFTQQKELYLFQVRPLVISDDKISIKQQEIALHQIKEKVDQLSAPHPYLYGDKTILGVMPDWNPAEIIGIRPRPLALSLYKELITNSTWAYQRDNYGYKNLRSFPLLVDFHGLPYIDVRVSFNSFLPKTIPSELSHKLVNYYLDCLRNDPSVHDKVEFDIVYSCYTFDLPERIKKLKENSFTSNEIKILTESLKTLTNTIIHKHQGLWKEDIQKIETLKDHYQKVTNQSSFDEISKIYWLIEDCKRYGTLPFAGLARAGFIAVQILNSLVTTGILTIPQRNAFLNSLESISSEMTKDLYILSKKAFLEKYGHLRPGTYDILSPRYDESPDLYFDWKNIKKLEPFEPPEFHLNLSQMKSLERLLNTHGLTHDVVGLFDFLKAAIEGREYSKFIFTKSLSDVLCLVKKLGEKYGLSLEDMSYIDIQTILNLYGSCRDIGKELCSSTQLGKSKYQLTSSILLPPVICSSNNIYAFELPENKPNFVTHKSVIAPVEKDLKNTQQMNKSIVFIPSADPGFDWIFSHNIGGFVTAYGGVNSHMAIRANELGIPAVIGAGEKLYQKWSKASKISIDCANQLVELIH